MKSVPHHAVAVGPVIADWQLPISDWCTGIEPIGNRQSKIGNVVPTRYRVVVLTSCHSDELLTRV
jgi:hypothetical protein